MLKTMKNNTQEIKENNILLAKFMGLEFNTDFGMFYVPIEKEEYNADSLKFHTDWNWLMQVVGKIESIGFCDYTVRIAYDICSIDYRDIRLRRDTPRVFKRAVEPSNKIEAVYNACVDFVKWWNQNKGGN